MTLCKSVAGAGREETPVVFINEPEHVAVGGLSGEERAAGYVGRTMAINQDRVKVERDVMPF